MSEQLTINKKWKWAAMAKSGGWLFFTEMPVITDESSWFVPDGDSCGGITDLFDFPDVEWEDSLRMIVDGELRPRLPLKKDDKVMVRVGSAYIPHHFSRYDDRGYPCVFTNGRTSFTTTQVFVAGALRLPTPEELGE